MDWEEASHCTEPVHRNSGIVSSLVSQIKVTFRYHSLCSRSISNSYLAFLNQPSQVHRYRQLTQYHAKENVSRVVGG